MNKVYSSVAMICLALNSYAQDMPSPKAEPVKYEYQENGYDIKKVDEKYAPKSTGEQFWNRLDAFNTINSQKEKRFVTNGDYKSFMHKMETISYGGEQTSRRIQNFISSMNEASSVPLNNDDYRNRLYNIASPVYTAIMEEWGDDVINSVLTTANQHLGEYMTDRARVDHSLENIAKNINDAVNRDYDIVMGSSEGCNYNMNIASPLTKEKMDIFFVDQRLYDKARKMYPTDKLLAGPVSAYTSLGDESQKIKHLMESELAASNHGIQYAGVKKSDKTYRFDQKLNMNMKWYLFAFRNGNLYYSYMVLPCSHLSKCTIK